MERDLLWLDDYRKSLAVLVDATNDSVAMDFLWNRVLFSMFPDYADRVACGCSRAGLLVREFNPTSSQARIH